MSNTVSGCDVWGSVDKNSDFPSASWSVDVEIVDIDTKNKFSESSIQAANLEHNSHFNIEFAIAEIKLQLDNLLKSVGKEEEEKLLQVGSISGHLDSLKKLLQLQFECVEERKEDDFKKVCDSSLISSLLTCPVPKLQGKAAQLVYHLLKREDQAIFQEYVKLKDISIFKQLVQLVDSVDQEVAKFWGLSAIEFFLREEDQGSRTCFVDELDGVALLMRVKDGYSHSVDLQNATDRILICIEEKEQPAADLGSNNLPPEEVATPPVDPNSSGGGAEDVDKDKSKANEEGKSFPVVGVWQPPDPKQTCPVHVDDKEEGQDKSQSTTTITTLPLDKGTATAVAVSSTTPTPTV